MLGKIKTIANIGSVIMSAILVGFSSSWFGEEW